MMTMILNWITYIAPYCENYTSMALYKDCTKDMQKQYVFSCRLNESKVGISLMLMDCMAHSMPILREIWNIECKYIDLLFNVGPGPHTW